MSEKKIIITGHTKGIGKAIHDRFKAVVPLSTLGATKPKPWAKTLFLARGIKPPTTPSSLVSRESFNKHAWSATS